MGERAGIARRRSRLAALALFASIGVACAAACLPDLAAFPAPPDAGSVGPIVESLCGDGVIETLEDGGDAGESCDPGDASVIGCESCRFTCSGAIGDAGHCYFRADDTSDFSRAAEACRAARGHLVTFASQGEADFVERFAGDGGYWVGLIKRSDKLGYVPPSDLVNEPGWPASAAACPGCFALGADDAGVFEPGEDAGAEAPEDWDCLVARSGKWLRVPCNGLVARPTICEREPAGERIYPCGGPLCTNLAVNAGAKRYIVGTARVSAKEAADFCASYPGGALGMFDTSEEREQLVREIAQRMKTPGSDLEVWIGLSFQDGEWRWDDGDAGRPAVWGSGQPGNGRGRAYLRITDTRFDTQLAQSDEDASADALRVFVCQRPVR